MPGLVRLGSGKDTRARQGLYQKRNLLEYVHWTAPVRLSKQGVGRSAARRPWASGVWSVAEDRAFRSKLSVNIAVGICGPGESGIGQIALVREAVSVDTRSSNGAAGRHDSGDKRMRRSRDTRRTRPPVRLRVCHSAERAVARLLAPWLRFDRLSWLRFLPSPPRVGRPWTPPVWPDKRTWKVADELRTVAGIWRNPGAEDDAFEVAPLHDFGIVNLEPTSDSMAYGWRYILPTGPRLVRALRRLGKTSHKPAVDVQASAVEPADITRRIRKEAARIGVSGIGFAPYDERYTFVEHKGKHDHRSVIICAVEQDFAATQTAPSVRAERSAFRAYGDIVIKLTALVEFIQALGYEARAQSPGGDGIAIHYGVQAGLGQLGLNGQLLTPMAGSRARLMMLTTNAPVVFDSPVDYGIHAICDACQLCVRRCPVGAIPLKRAEYRGVVKAKIKTERCLPVASRVHGCAVCMKVCPVQRYGLEAVTNHLLETGTILGKGSDELEGYDWPPDGRRYGPGDKPPVTAQLLNPPGWRWSGGGLAESAKPVTRQVMTEP